MPFNLSQGVSVLVEVGLFLINDQECNIIQSASDSSPSKQYCLKPSVHRTG
jgi:hypothetical protein